MTVTMYPKVCGQCGGAFDAPNRRFRFCASCARARKKAAAVIASKRDAEQRRCPFRVPCACGRRLVNLRRGESACSECRAEKAAALRNRAFAVPRAIGERRRLIGPGSKP